MMVTALEKQTNKKLNEKRKNKLEKRKKKKLRNNIGLYQCWQTHIKNKQNKKQKNG